MKRIQVFILLALCCTTGQATDFNFEFLGTVSGEDFGTAFDADFYTLDARYYFNAISDSDGPYREAAFINPASSIAVSYANADSSEKDTAADSDDAQLLGSYFNRSRGWYINFGLGRGDAETREGPEIPETLLDAPLVFPDGAIFGLAAATVLPEPATTTTSANSNGYSLGIGQYLGARTTLGMSYSRTDTDADMDSIICYDNDLPVNIFGDFSPQLQCFTQSLATRNKIKTDNWHLTLKHLGAVAHTPLAFRGTVGYLKSSTKSRLRFIDAEFGSISARIDPKIFDFDPTVPFLDSEVFIPAQPSSTTDYGWNTSADITLYPRKNLGITIAYDYADVEDLQTKTYGATVDWFVTRRFAVALSYADTDFDNNAGNNEIVALRLSGRF